MKSATPISIDGANLTVAMQYKGVPLASDGIREKSNETVSMMTLKAVNHCPIETAAGPLECVEVTLGVYPNGAAYNAT
jgi:hypothetical protein